MTTGEGIAWAAFWVFVAVFVYADAQVFISGRDTLLQAHKTPAEKALQQAAIEAAQRKAEN